MFDERPGSNVDTHLAVSSQVSVFENVFTLGGRETNRIIYFPNDVWVVCTGPFDW